MRLSPCPQLTTQSYVTNTKTCGLPQRGHRQHTPFSVTALLPFGAAVLLTLTSASPGAVAAISDTEAETELGGVHAELASLHTELEELREDASIKIDHYVEERERLDAVVEAREVAEGNAETARTRRDSTRLTAARRAAAAYKGQDLGMVHAFTGPEGPAGMLERGAYLMLLGERRAADLERAEAARVASDTLTDVLESAEQEQRSATEDAEVAREEAETAVTTQEERSEELMTDQTRLEARLAEERDQGEDEARRESALLNARAAAGTDADSAREPAVTEAGTGDGGDGSCSASDPADGENGKLPDAALCPLPQSGEMLRADAAEAFLELDGAFREEFERPLCVTDSYRPYHEQVRLFQEMLPGMAAQPGTSKHGLGVAVDLCGGVNELDSTEHRWMLETAPEYGWVNPDWARDGFEPWHWEYDPR